MKTASVPNDPMTQQLMEVSAELTLACDQFEKHIVDHASERLTKVVQQAFSDIKPMLDDIPGSEATLKKILWRSVMEGATETNTFNKIQEKAKGINGEFAPSVITDLAITQANVSLFEWSKVSS